MMISMRNVCLLVPCILAAVILSAITPALSAEDADYPYRVLGLFQQDREADLKLTLEELPGVGLVRVDYLSGSATFRFDAENVFPGAKTPEQILNQFDQRLSQASRGTFKLTAATNVDRETLEKVVIGVAGLDCKGCSYGAYRAVFQIEGVENAVASFRDGHVTAWIDSKQTDREALEAALLKAKVTVVNSGSDSE